MTAANAETKRGRRGLRRVLIGAGAIIALLIILFFLLPTFIGWGLFHRQIRDAIGASFNGDVSVDGLSVSWFGAQHIEELRVIAPDGDAEARLNLRLERGLLPLALGSTEYGTLHVRGAIEGVLYEDGSTSLQKLLKESDDEAEPLDMTVHVVSDGIDVSLRDRASDDELAIRGLMGSLAFDPVGRTEISLKGETSAGGETGHLEARGSIDGLYDESGALALRDAAFDVTARLAHVPVAVLDGLLGFDGRLTALAGEAIETAEITVDGGTAGGTADVAITSSQLGLDAPVKLDQGHLLVDPAAPISIAINLPAESLETLFGPDRAPAIAIAPGQSAAILANISAARIALPDDAGIDLSGGVISATLETSDLPLLAGAGDFEEMIEIASLHASVETDDLTREARISIEGTGTVRGEGESALHAALAIAEPFSPQGALTLDPANIEGTLSALALPTAVAQGLLGESPVVLARDLGPSADITMEFTGGDQRAIHATLAAANANGELRATIGPDGGIHGQETRFALRMTPELAAAYLPGRLAAPGDLALELSTFTWPAPAEGESRAWEEIGGAGTLVLSGVPLSAPADDDSIAIESATIEFDTPALLESLTATIAAVVEGGPVTASVTTSSADVEVVLTSLEATAAATPALVRALQGASEDPIEASAETLALSLASPATLLSYGDDGYELALDSIALRVTSPEVIITRAPVIAQPVALRGVAGDLNALLGETGRFELIGSASIHTGSADIAPHSGAVASAAFTVDLPLATKPAPGTEPALNEDGPAYPALDLTLTGIDVASAERVLGREPGALARYLGPSGALELDFAPTADGFTATLVPQFPHVAGRYRAAKREATIAIEADDASITLSAGAVSEFLTPAGDPAVSDESAAVIAAADDVPLSLTINSLVLPAEILTGDPLSTTSAEVDLALAIREPLALTRTAGDTPPETASFEELSLAVTGNDLDQGISVVLAGLVKSATDTEQAAATVPADRDVAADQLQGPARSRLDVSATLANLLNDGMALDLAGATITGEARARRVPAWIADAAARTNSLLHDALGATITAEATAENFSVNSGTLTANIGGANESRIRAKLTGREGGFAAERGDPITGALTLTPELRNRLLHGIHPILSDVRALNEQVRFKVRNAFVPVSGNEPPAASDSPEDVSQSSIPASPGTNPHSSIDLSRLSGVIELTIGPAEFTAGSEFLRILSFVELAQGDAPPSLPEATENEGAPASEKVIEGFIGPLDGSPIIIRINNGRLRYDNFVVHLKREDDEPARRQPRERRERRRDRQDDAVDGAAFGSSRSGSEQDEGASDDVTVPAEYEHQLLFSGDIDLVNKRVNRIVGAYPLADLVANIRGSAPADLLGLNIGTVGVRFFGDLFDAGGHPLDLQYEIDFDLKVEDFFREGLRSAPGEDAPALQRLLDEIFRN